LPSRGEPIDPDSLRRRYDALLQSVADGVIGVDAKGRVTFMSLAAARILGYAADELAGQFANDSFHRMPVEESAVFAALADGTVHHVRGGEAFTRKDGRALPVEYTCTPLRTAGGDVAGALITFRPQAERAAAGGAMSRPLARKIVHGIIEAGSVAHTILQQVGRKLATEVPASDIESYLRAYADMGLGEIRLEKGEEGRFSFQGHDLLERRGGSRVATCFFTLGYLSEAVSRVNGGEPTLGTEIDCQSRGSQHCRFVVQVKKPEEGLARRVKELV
jgi:PAS domain S-box-containing protein